MTTATELYKQNAEFRQLIACWVQDRQPPLCLPDYLMEQGLLLQAECVGWCLEQPARKCWHWKLKYSEMITGSVYPCVFIDRSYGWDCLIVNSFTDNIPEVVYNSMCSDPVKPWKIPNRPTAFKLLLDHWAKVITEHPAALPRYYQPATAQ